MTRDVMARWRERFGIYPVFRYERPIEALEQLLYGGTTQ